MAHVHVRINDTTKKKVQEILKSLGLDVSTAVNLYFERIVIDEGIPFSVCKHPICSGKKNVPDHIMERWKQESEEALREGCIFDNVEDLFNSWNKEDATR